MLTQKQHDLLIFIHRRLNDTGVSPSFEEMKKALDLRSKSGIHRLITGLEERGFIRRLPHRARALEVVKLPEDAFSERPARNPKVVEAITTRQMVREHPSNPEITSLSLYGRIAAGTPIEALRDDSNHVDVPTNLLGRGQNYALEVDGDSMVDAGILDGDVVIIERSETADTGDIVVALIDNAEVTLKRFRKKTNSIALEPANVNYETRIFGPDRVKVQGRLVGLLRRY